MGEVLEYSQLLSQPGGEGNGPVGRAPRGGKGRGWPVGGSLGDLKPGYDLETVSSAYRAGKITEGAQEKAESRFQAGQLTAPGSLPPGTFPTLL